MGTSAAMSTSNSYVKYQITINQNSQNTPGNYSNVTVLVSFWRTNSGYSTYGTGTVYCKINGSTYSASVTTSQKITNSGITLFSKTLNIDHNNDGSKTLTTSAWISMDVLSSSEQSYSQALSNIPRAATISDAENFTDEDNPKVWFNNPGGFKLRLQINRHGGTPVYAARIVENPSSPYTFYLSSDERGLLRSSNTSAKTDTVSFDIQTYLDGTNPSNDVWVNRTMTIVNANPIFTSDQLTYQDTNGAVIEITGDNQLIVQNQSNLQISFSAAQALKYASISSYQVTFNGITTSYSSPGTYSLGAINSSQNLELQVKAIDSRGNSTTISKPVTLLNWTPPVINALAERINNFENETNLTPNVQISSVNNLNAITLLQYRAKKTSDAVWGSWIDVPNSKTQIVLDNIYAWDLEIQCSDKFSSAPSTATLSVPKGMPIMFFDTEKLSIGVNCFPSNSESFEVGGATVLNGEKMIFESGTWAPSLASRNGTNPTNTVQYRYGYYKRFNDLCFIAFHGKWDISNAGTDYACVTGLPYTAGNNMNGQGLALREIFGAIDQNPTKTGIIPDGSLRIELNGNDGAYACQWQTGDVWVGFSGVYKISTQ